MNSFSKLLKPLPSELKCTQPNFFGSLAQAFSYAIFASNLLEPNFLASWQNSFLRVPKKLLAQGDGGGTPARNELNSQTNHALLLFQVLAPFLRLLKYPDFVSLSLSTTESSSSQRHPERCSISFM